MRLWPVWDMIGRRWKASLTEAGFAHKVSICWQSTYWLLSHQSVHPYIRPSVRPCCMHGFPIDLIQMSRKSILYSVSSRNHPFFDLVWQPLDFHENLGFQVNPAFWKVLDGEGTNIYVLQLCMYLIIYCLYFHARCWAKCLKNDLCHNFHLSGASRCSAIPSIYPSMPKAKENWKQLSKCHGGIWKTDPKTEPYALEI